MDLKDIQQKLVALRNRIRSQGGISAQDEYELKTLIDRTVVTATDELGGIQVKMASLMHTLQAENDNCLSAEQRQRLSLVERTGAGSGLIH